MQHDKKKAFLTSIPPFESLVEVGGGGGGVGGEVPIRYSNFLLFLGTVSHCIRTSQVPLVISPLVWKSINTN